MKAKLQIKVDLSEIEQHIKKFQNRGMVWTDVPCNVAIGKKILALHLKIKHTDGLQESDDFQHIKVGIQDIKKADDQLKTMLQFSDVITDKIQSVVRESLKKLVYQKGSVRKIYELQKSDPAWSLSISEKQYMNKKNMEILKAVYSPEKSSSSPSVEIFTFRHSRDVRYQIQLAAPSL